MSYVTQNFEDGKVLKAEHLNYIERNLVSISKNSDKVPGKANAFVAEASGDIVTFYPDEGSPLGVTAHIEPVQAGSGDPYPAGGGKNLLGSYSNAYYAGTRNGLEVTPQADGTLKITGTPTTLWSNLYEEVPCNIPAGEYVYSYETDLPNTVTIGLALKYSNGTHVDLKTLGSKVTLTENVIVCKVYLENTDTTKNYNNTLRLQLEKGSTPTPYAPYSNIRPISGHTGCDVTRSGKNLACSDVSSITRFGITVNGNGGSELVVYGIAMSTFGIEAFETLLATGTYIYSLGDIGNISRFEISIDGTPTAHLFGNDSAKFTLDSPAVVKLYPIFYEGVNCGTEDNPTVVKAQLEIGSVATAYEPYQGANTYVMDFGKNMLRNEWVDGNTSCDSLGIRVSSKYTIPIVAGETYTLSSNDYTNYRYVINTDATLSTYPFKHTDGEPGSTYQECGNNINWVQRPITFTATANGYMAIVISKPGDAALTVSEVEKLKIQLERGSTATTYAPYNSTLLAQTGGMVYGGTVDWNTGVLMVDRGYAVFDGGENWVVFTYEDGRKSFYTSGSNALPGIITGTYINIPGICSWSPSVDGYITDVLRTDADSAAIEIKPEVLSKWGIGDLDDLKAKLQANPMQIVYKLATPTTIQLTTKEILALKGGNTVYTNAGPVTVEYNKSLSKAFEEVLAKLAALEAAVVNNV